MLESLKKSELLALVEGELTPEDEAEILRQLAPWPKSIERLNQIRADRNTLCSMPEPTLDEDLVDRLEPAIVRSMLLDSDGVESASDSRPTDQAQFNEPGAYRARHRRRRLRPLALVAGLTLIAATGVLIVIERHDGTVDQKIVEPGFATPGGIAADTTQSRPPAHDTPAADDDVATPRVIHHLASTPPPGGTTPADDALGSNEATIQPPTFRLASGHAAFEAPLSLRIDAAIADEVLKRLSASVRQIQTAALTRNFTEDEVERAWNAAVVAAGNTSDARRDIAGWSDVMQPHSLHPRLLSRQDRASLGAAMDRIDLQLGEHLAGMRTFEAPPILQIEYARTGATYTITMPRALLVPFIESLGTTWPRQLSLGSLDHSDHNTEISEQWIRWQRWHAAIDALRDLPNGNDDVLVILPIVIDPIR